MWFEFASAQIQGKRTAQEDAVEVLLPGERRDVAPGAAEQLVIAMADGMGGHVGGRIASSIVSKQFLEGISPTGVFEERAVSALNLANDSLKSATDKRPDLDGMGSTLVGVSISREGLSWVSIGDTGLFLLRDGHYQRLNEDHSFGAYLDEQVAKGLISHELAATDRRRNQLFHALLGDPIEHFECRLARYPLAPGDTLLMATDGLKTLEDDHVGQFLLSCTQLPANDVVLKLLDVVEQENRPRQDNATIVMVRVRDGEMPEPPSLSRLVAPFLTGRGPDEPDTTIEIRPEGDHATRLIPHAVKDAPEIRIEPDPDMVGRGEAAIDTYSSPRSLILLMSVGVVCLGLIGLLWYVLSGWSGE